MPLSVPKTWRGNTKLQKGDKPMTDYIRLSQRRTTLASANLTGDDDGDGQRRFTRAHLDLAGLPRSDARLTLHRPSGAICWCPSS